MRVERTVRTFVIGAVLAGAALAPATVVLGQETKPTLYKRLGGYDALAAVTDDFHRPVGRRSRASAVSSSAHSKELAGPHPSAHRRPALRRHRRSLRLHRPRHEDGARRSGHHRCRLGERGQAPEGDARQVQGAQAGAGRDPGRDRRHEEGHRRASQALAGRGPRFRPETRRRRAPAPSNTIRRCARRCHVSGRSFSRSRSSPRRRRRRGSQRSLDRPRRPTWSSSSPTTSATATSAATATRPSARRTSTAWRPRA